MHLPGAIWTHSRAKSVAVTLLLTLVWFAAVLHGRLFAPLFAGTDVRWLTPFIFLAGALVMHLRPKSFNGVYAIALFWLFANFMSLWSVGAEAPWVARMLIPIGDSAGYFFEASRLTHGDPFTGYAAAHLLSHACFASGLYLSSYNMMAVHAALAAAVALSVSLFAKEARAGAGPVAASLLLTLSLMAILEYLGTYSSETYALCMGLAGTAAILGGIRKERMGWQAAGLFIIGIGLAARPGAFFVLPATGFALATMQSTWKRRGLSLGIMAAASIGSVALNVAATRILSLPDATPMSMDIWHHLNGMLKGTSWNASISCYSAQQAHDEVLRMLRENPALIFEASWRAISYFFTHHTAFAFVRYKWLVRTLPWLALAGALYCGLHWKNRLNRLAIFAFLGIVLSIPFLPPWDAGIRTYYATMPLQLMILALPLGALAGLAGRLTRRNSVKEPVEGPHPAWGAALAALLLATSTILPYAMLHGLPHRKEIQPAYWDGWAYLRLFKGNCVRITADDDPRAGYLPFIRHKDYLGGKKGPDNRFDADYAAVYNRMPQNVLVTRGDTVGYVFVIKDDFGDTLPDTIQAVAGDMIQLMGDRVVYDKRLGIKPAEVTAILDSFYLPWLRGYEYYYHYHPVLGATEVRSSIPGGTVRLSTQNYGLLETSQAEFPRFTRVKDKSHLVLDMDKKTMNPAP